MSGIKPKVYIDTAIREPGHVTENGYILVRRADLDEGDKLRISCRFFVNGVHVGQEGHAQFRRGSAESLREAVRNLVDLCNRHPDGPPAPTGDAP